MELKESPTVGTLFSQSWLLTGTIVLVTVISQWKSEDATCFALDSDLLKMNPGGGGGGE